MKNSAQQQLLQRAGVRPLSGSEVARCHREIFTGKVSRLTHLLLFRVLIWVLGHKWGTFIFYHLGGRKWEVFPSCTRDKSYVLIFGGHQDGFFKEVRQISQYLCDMRNQQKIAHVIKKIENARTAQDRFKFTFEVGRTAKRIVSQTIILCMEYRCGTHWEVIRLHA